MKSQQIRTIKKPGPIRNQVNNQHSKKINIAHPPWPYYKLFISQQTLKSRIQQMQQLKFKISHQPRKPVMLNLKTTTIQPTFKGKFTTFVDDNYLKYDILPLVYSEPELLKCQFRGQPSPLTQYSTQSGKLWHEFQTKQRNNKFHKNKTIKNQSTARIKMTPEIFSAYREFLYSKIKACNNYRPTLAMQTYWFLGPVKPDMSVLDFSAGWGDRLFAACASQIKYIGLDPNTNNRKVYDTIIQNHGALTLQRVITTGAEYLPDTTLKQNMAQLGITEFDLITTSPPYYDYEVYSDTAQSAMGFIDAPRWLIFWLGQVIFKYIPYLRPGGYFALYLQDTDQNSFVEPLTLFILSNPGLFGNLECCGIINSTRFPMVVFQKPNQKQQQNKHKHTHTHLGQPSTANEQIPNKYQKIFQTTYPQHAKLSQLWRRTHQHLADINTDSLTRTVVKYLINRTNQIGYIPQTQKYISLAQEFQVRVQPIKSIQPIQPIQLIQPIQPIQLINNSPPEQLDKLFMELWRESIEEYKLIYGPQPETNIQPPEYQQVYDKIFNSIGNSTGNSTGN